MENIIDYRSIGGQIRSARIAKNMTQEKMAELTELSISHVSHIESGVTKIGLPALVRVANVLDVSMDYLLQDNEATVYDSDLERMHLLLHECDDTQKDAVYKICSELKDIMNKRSTSD